MRILFLTPGCFDKGGISRYSRYQISALREIFGSQNVRVLSLLGPGENSLEEDFDVYWHGKIEDKVVSKIDRIGFSWKAIQQAVTWRPDVVHSAHVNFGPLVSRLARLAGAKTILNVYGLEIWSGLSEVRKSHMLRNDAIIADCYFTARFVSDSNLHPVTPSVIWDCVDLRRFSPSTPSLNVLQKYGIPSPEKHFLIVSLGRLSKTAAHKGFDRLIKVVSPLCANNPDIRLVIAGRGDDRIRLELLAKEQGIEDRVIFTGSVDDEDLPHIYSCADVFSLVSDRGHGRGEGIPLTPLEAMACQSPIIVGNEDGSQEAVVNERNGFIVSPRDDIAHRDVLQRLIDEPTTRNNMASEARLVAEEHFSYKQFVEKHKSFYSNF